MQNLFDRLINKYVAFCRSFSRNAVVEISQHIDAGYSLCGHQAYRLVTDAWNQFQQGSLH